MAGVNSGTLVQWDRAKINIDGIAYLDGYIQNFRIGGATNSKALKSMTPDGLPLGTTMGNTEYSVSWKEILPDTEKYINFRELCKANPDMQISIIPFKVSADGKDIALPYHYIISGINPTGNGINGDGEGEELTRSVSFIATRVSGL
jgi:hypothetical protein